MDFGRAPSERHGTHVARPGGGTNAAIRPTKSTTGHRNARRESSAVGWDGSALARERAAG